ncbi:uncharacterized protein LOC121962898 [Plectropomus leopardus]|uniref:uncharacterized protein LOC121962898 n=1 Tax=Plectropomus leopardus TaxID=160734 RepID=UPI001C4BF147|nr:uncharacterized protein LOC121962898 [Plectropomus leopardus]
MTVVCWVFMILLSCMFSHANNSPSIICREKLKIARVPVGVNVPVPCPKLTTEDVTFNLLKDEEVFYNSTCIREKNAQNCTPSYTRMGVELQENTEYNNSVSFLLTRVNTSSYGIYRCDGIIIYPPPVRKVQNTMILVLVKGQQCPQPVIDGDQKDRFLWFWILGIVVLGVYSLIVTIIAGTVWVKWRRSDSQSDYMNTKPKAARDRRKKRGVQIPIPRHF